VICAVAPCDVGRRGASFLNVHVAQRGCPMDGQRYLLFEAGADVPSALALMTFVSLWGFIACTAALFCIAPGP